MHYWIQSLFMYKLWSQNKFNLLKKLRIIREQDLKFVEENSKIKEIHEIREIIEIIEITEQILEETQEEEVEKDEEFM